MGLSRKEAWEIVGGLSKPSKMPGWGYGLPAKECLVGSRLREVEGSVCNGCYALKGHYMFPNVQEAQYRRLEALASSEWVDAMIILIKHHCAKEPYFRWHDSGDLQSVEHLGMICMVAEQTPDVKHWLPTREYEIVRKYVHDQHIPGNLTVRLSAHKIDQKSVPLGEKLGLPTSVVSTEAPEWAHDCPSRFQDNSCGDCRACWDPEVKVVSYHKH